MDLRVAMRAIVRSPGFAALIVATMALGIGGNTTMFAVIRAVFLRPLPFPDPERLVTVWESDPERGIRRQRVSGPNFVDWEAQGSVFDAMGALPGWTGGPAGTFNVVGREGMERVPGLYASSGFFRVLGVQPELGRALGPDDDRRQGERHVVISHTYWKDHLAADPRVLGKTIEIDTFRGGKFAVIGVMPPGFEFPRGASLWLSLGDWGGGPLPPLDMAERCCPWHAVFARLKPGVTADRAASELTVIAKRISAQHPGAPRVARVQVVPLRESLVGTHRLALGTLFGAVGCVLLIGCANVANLMLSRGVGRHKELFTRIALGATRARIARQLIVESLLLCGPGAIAGVLVALWAQGPLARAIEGRIPLVEDTRVDAAVLGFAVLLTVISGVVCGLAPLIEWPAADLRGRGQTESPTTKRLRQALVVGEVALAVILVASAGLLLRTVAKLQAVDVGFQMERILSVSIDVTTGPLRGRGNAARFLGELIPRIAALPGVGRVGATTETPLEAGTAEQSITREDRPALLAAESPQVMQSAVTPGYFGALGVAVKNGRSFTEADTATGTLVAILNETAARRYWPGEDPIGKRFAVGSRERFGFFRAPLAPGAVEWREVVGVVADTRSAGFAADVQPEVYYSYQQFPLYDPKLLVRTTGDPLALTPAIRREIRALSDRAVVTRVRTMEQVAAESLVEPRLRATLVASFSTIALALGMLGIYSVMSYTVGQRSQEIGIRMALGAQNAQVSRMIVGQAIRMTMVGILIGLAGALAAARWIGSLLFGIPPLDVPTFVGTCLLMLTASMLASYPPGRRAMRVDPAVALRSE